MDGMKMIEHSEAAGLMTNSGDGLGCQAVRTRGQATGAAAGNP